MSLPKLSVNLCQSALGLSKNTIRGFICDFKCHKFFGVTTRFQPQFPRHQLVLFTTPDLLQCHSRPRPCVLPLNSRNQSFSSPRSLVNVNVREFRTSPRRDALPPVIAILLSRIAHFGAILGGRYFRKWWKKLPKDKKAEYKARAYGNRLLISGIFGALAFGTFVYYERHIQETPVTKRRRFVAFNEQQFCQISDNEFKQLLTEYRDRIVPASEKEPLYIRVANVAHRLLDSNKDIKSLADKNWTITVVNEPNEQNAFVLPCGNIFVFSGMLDLCENDSQLGTILAHEMAHCVLGHGGEQASNLYLIDMLIVIPIAILWAIFPTDITAIAGHLMMSTLSKIIFTLPYGRHLETEADEVGLLMAAKACFDIREATILWEKMAMISEAEGEPQVEWLSTHPTHESRITLLEEMMPQALTIRDNNKCPKLKFLDAAKRISDYNKALQAKEKLLDQDKLAFALKKST